MSITNKMKQKKPFQHAIYWIFLLLFNALRIDMGNHLEEKKQLLCGNVNGWKLLIKY